MTDIDQFFVHSCLFNELTKDHLKQVKRLLRSTTGERMITAQQTDPIYMVFDKKEHLIGYAMVSSYSPEKHFKIEGPYIYNFVTDINLAKEKRCGRFLLEFIEHELAEQNYNIINLDVLHDNLHAFKFFIKNKYRVIGKYEMLDIRNMDLHEIDNAIKNLKLTEKVEELKRRRGISSKESEIITETAPNKKIVYISLTKKINVDIN